MVFIFDFSINNAIVKKKLIMQTTAETTKIAVLGLAIILIGVSYLSTFFLKITYIIARLNISEQLRKLEWRINMTAKYFGTDMYTREHLSELIEDWEEKRREIINQAIIDGKSIATEKHSRKLREIILQIYDLETKI